MIECNNLLKKKMPQTVFFELHELKTRDVFIENKMIERIKKSMRKQYQKHSLSCHPLKF